MILSEKEQKTLDILSELRERVRLLDGLKTTQSQYITEKQYKESLAGIMDQVIKIEMEYGIEETPESQQLREIDEKLAEIEAWLSTYETVLDKEYDKVVHLAIDDLERERNGISD